MIMNYENPHPDIFVMDADGSNVRNLSNSPEDDDYFPVWSPDGLRIAFSSDREGIAENTSIYVADADGAAPPRTTIVDTLWPRPVWSPDGASIAWLIMGVFGGEGNRSGGSVIIDANTGDLRPLIGDFPDAHFLAWSPDGAQIAFQIRQDGEPKIYLVDADGGNLHSLTEDNAYDMAWSPDGTQIAFTTRPNDEPPSEIWVMDADGSNPRKLTNGSIRMWSPDGTRIAFAREGESYILDVDSADVRQSPGGPYFSWSPDATRIAYAHSGFGGLCVMEVDGTNIRCLDVGLYLPRPAWSPDGQYIAYWEHNNNTGVSGFGPTVVGIDEIDALPTVTPAPPVTPQS